jgi:GT2 family glycosyltransferase
MKTTLLITLFNRGELLRNSLERLTHITIPDEVLIIHDGGTDNTKEVCDSFKDRLPIRYIYNNDPKPAICSMGRNIGIKEAIGDIIITSEPELLFVTDIVKQMLEEREKYPREIISAGVIYHAQTQTTFNPGLITDPQEALKSEIVEEYQTEPRSYHPSGYCKTRNMQATFTCLYEKEWLMEIGGWDEAFPGAWGWEDIELCTRLRINGINQHICSHMEALHQWHPHLPGPEWGEASKMNEDYFISKQLNIVEQDIQAAKIGGTYTQIDPRLIANQGKEWGIII